MEEEMTEWAICILVAVALLVVAAIGASMVAEKNRPKKCIEGVMMQLTERGWESEYGNYARLCNEDLQ